MTSMARAVHGTVDPGFERVRDAFVRNFEKRGEIGGAFCAFVGDRKVVDLWGGWAVQPAAADGAGGREWTADTLVNVYSVTKSIAAMCVLQLVDRQLAQLDDPVCRYWSGFAKSGKQDITISDLLSHQAGLTHWDTPVDVALLRAAQKERQSSQSGAASIGIGSERFGSTSNSTAVQVGPSSTSSASSRLLRILEEQKPQWSLPSSMADLQSARNAAFNAMVDEMDERDLITASAVSSAIPAQRNTTLTAHNTAGTSHTATTPQLASAPTPRTICGYHALSVGPYVSELVRRIDPKGRTLRQYFADEIASKHNIDFHFGLDDKSPIRSRVARLYTVR